MQATGVGGTLRVGYQVAARLGAWELEAVRAAPTLRFTISAAVRHRDAHWVTQRPLAVDLRFGRWHWAWAAALEAHVTDTAAALVVYGPPRMTRDGEV